MNTAFVLIVVFLNGYGPRQSIQFQEFTTLERCETAADVTRKLWASTNDAYYLKGALCLPK
jgi:hypothetical protein